MSSVVLMSTYNGVRYLQQQLNSLLSLDTSPDIFIRDDGSTDGTRDILIEYQRNNNNIKIVYGDNVGVVGGFLNLIKLVEKKYDYYAFCDQDDFWEKEKILKAINKLEKINGSALYCSRLNVVDEHLKHLFYSNIPKRGLTLANALVENVATGCTLVVNKHGMDIIISHMPRPDKVVMHDWWVYLTISATGQVIFDETSYIKYRQHGENVEGMSNGIFKIIKKFIGRPERSKYTPLIEQLIEFKRLYGEMLSSKDIIILNELISSIVERNKYNVVKMILSKKIFRQTTSENLSLIYSIISGKI
ncbi:glycosyltransferase [Serratia sp. J2]|uniref:glycosyltransferase n=1 Tax=Serratia sp. J2 TaxID=3386551 RepID=UPI00391752EA